MYSSTAFRLEWPTENTPQPDCQLNVDEQASLVFTHVDVSVLIFSTNFAIVIVRDKPTSKWT